MKTYTIEKNNHEPSPVWYYVTLGNSIQFFKKKMFKKFKFDKSCAYDLKSIDQFDINKLFGWSQGYHETNSARFGWTWNLTKKKMEIHAYCHVKGKPPRVEEFICDVDLDVWYIGEIWVDNGNYYFRVLTEDRSEILGYTSIESNYKVNIGYLLKPFFGGNQPAPQDMKIYLDNA